MDISNRLHCHADGSLGNGARNYRLPDSEAARPAESRIIRASSDRGDVVLDPFCGSGTALVAAAQAGRRWIGIDSSPEAIRVAQQRLSIAEKEAA